MLKHIKILLTTIMILIALPMAFSHDGEHNDTEIHDLKSNADKKSEISLNAEVDLESEIITQKEAIILKDSTGAKIRVFQLTRKLENHIEDGKTIIKYIQENTEEDFSQLEEIISEMELLLTDINEFNPEGKTAADLAEKFTSSKALAIELTISFKTVASQILTDEQKDQIREIVDERREERKALRDDKIAELRKEYNKEKAKEIAQRLGVGVESIENIESEDLTANEIKRRLINDFRKLDDSQKERLVTNLREENQKIRLEARQKEEELRSKYEERIRDLETKLREREKQSEIKIREDANTRAEVQKEIQQDKDVIGISPRDWVIREDPTDSQTRDLRIGQQTIEKIKLHLGDTAQSAIEELEKVIEKKRYDVEILSKRAEDENTSETVMQAIIKKIELLEKQIESLEIAKNMVSSENKTFRGVHIDEMADGKLNISITKEDSSEIEVETKTERNSEVKR